MSDYFDLLEAELRSAVPRAATTRQRLRSKRRPIRLRSGTVPAVLGLAAVVLVVGLALGTLRHGHAPQGRAAPPTSASGSAVPTLRQLLDNFVTLRRAQTAADRAWHPTGGGGMREVPRLTRLARTLPGGDRVFLIVEQLHLPLRGQAAGTYSLQVRVVHPDGSTDGTSFSPSAQYTVFPFPVTPPGQFPTVGRTPSLVHVPPEASTATKPPGALVWTSIVPDGVGAVRWTFTCGRPTPSCSALAPVAVTVPVRNNVASMRVPGTGVCDGTAVSCRQPSSVVWYSSGDPGRQVARFAITSRVTRAPFVLKPAPPPVNGVPPRPALEMLSGGGVAGISFGRSRTPAVTELNRRLGVRGGAPRTSGGDCGVGSSITWRLGAEQPSLRAYFAHGRLVGYQYGGDVGHRVPAGSDRQGPKLGTPRGLTIGDTLDVGRRLYGSAFTFGRAQGGTWKAVTGTGPIDGYLSGVPQTGNANTLRVVTIDAGNVGCPAVSP